MNKKLYDLMNWPDIEGITYSECENPKMLLGGHVCSEGLLIQVYRPDAVEVSVRVADKKIYELEKVDESGFFAVLVAGRRKQKYTVTVENVKGQKETYIDPYSMDNCNDAKAYKSFLAGNMDNAWELLGSHVTTVKGIDGTLFSVWAPNAVRVSVVGAFNHWDGRINMMEKISDTGVFELFIPGITAGTEYNYEVKSKSGKAVVKVDPYAVSISSDFLSVVCDDTVFGWSDNQWMKARADRQSIGAPMSVYEVSLEAWADGMKIKGADYRNLAESICDYVKKTGYTHIELMPIAEYKRSTMMGYGTIGYFSPTGRFGNPEDFKSFVEVFHNAGIGVILDWNGAYFSDDTLGLDSFDGTDIYGWLKPSLEKYPKWKVTTFDYGRAEVRSFLNSSVNMWLERFHIDGIRIDGVASMMYLDYGKEPGQWRTNIYGGTENLDAENFIKELRKKINKSFPEALLIAEESSGWSGVTESGYESNETESLGFNYKWDYSWKNDFLSFINKDPLFRKGEYGKLTYAMLYHYSENFILELSHDEFTEDKCSMYEMVSGSDSETKLADLRAAYGYMFTHPGRKLLCMGQDIGLPQAWTIADAVDKVQMEKPEYQKMIKYISDLNRIYQSNSALYEQDDVSDGFEWLDSSSVEETVISYVRRADSGEELTVVVNFTPVLREGFRLAVAKSGKYKEIFNSDSTEYGGKTKVQSKINYSDEIERYGRENSISIDLPPSSMIILECKPYTEIELKEIAIKKTARIAKEEAEREAEVARQLKEKAEEEARIAVEAEQRAKAAAEAALKAQAEAEKKAAAAIKASLKIDAETKKKLAELKKA